MVEFQNVTKVYDDGTRALDQLNLTIERGEFVVFIGPSGCGKTTSLKMINHLETPTEGTVLVGGQDVSGVNPVELRRGIGYVIQEIGLLPHLTVEENIGTVPHLLGWRKKRTRERVDELLALSGLDPTVYRHRLPAQLSGGQQQRIGVLRALAADPDVVLMDEPFGALDPITKANLQQELLELQQRVQKTIIFVTHDIDEALKLGDRVVLMRRGAVEQMGSPDHLQNEPVNEFVRSFIGEDRLSQISPEGPVDTLIEEAPLQVWPDTDPTWVLERLEELSRETAQVVDRRGRWHGMMYLADLLEAERKKRTSVEGLGRRDRKLTQPEATVRDAAVLLVDLDAPVPVIREDGTLAGVITNGGVARLTISRLTRGGGAQ
ncbi:MAG: ABC transporter ATP-binding protein [Spirochaeta sp.]|nr:ABC transporter ATP-binding protein [Spirochaeta sp.]